MVGSRVHDLHLPPDVLSCRHRRVIGLKLRWLQSCRFQVHDLAPPCFSAAMTNRRRRANSEMLLITVMEKHVYGLPPCFFAAMTSRCQRANFWDVADHGH